MKISIKIMIVYVFHYICLPFCFQTLLDLGVSPNMKDSRSLTPLYYTVSHCTSPTCMEMLLQERAFIGAQDEQGWFEIHHVRNYIMIACGRLSFDLIIYILMHVKIQKYRLVNCHKDM